MSVFGRSALVLALMVAAPVMAAERPLQPADPYSVYRPHFQPDRTAIDENSEGDRLALTSVRQKDGWKRRAQVRNLMSDADKALGKGDAVTACALAQKAEATDADYAASLQRQKGETETSYCAA